MAIAALALAGCAAEEPSEQAASTTPEASPSAVLAALPTVPELFGEATWSATSATGVRSLPIIDGNHVVLLQDDGILAVDSSGVTEWEISLDLLVNAGHPEGDRMLIAAGAGAVALVDKGKLPEGSEDPLAADSSGVRVTILDVTDGSEIGTAMISGDEVERTTGLAFEATTQGRIEYVAISTEGEKITAQGERLPIATVGNHVIWGTPYVANMGVATMRTVDLPVENAVVHDGGTSGVAVLYHDDTSTWLDVAANTMFTPDDSCASAPNAGALRSSADGAYVVGAEAIANVKDHTMACIGSGANQKVVTWQAITDDGVAYGTAEGSDAMFVVAHGDNVKTYPIPAEAEKTRVLGFTSDGTAILFDANTGTVNGNPSL